MMIKLMSFRLERSIEVHSAQHVVEFRAGATPHISSFALTDPHPHQFIRVRPRVRSLFERSRVSKGAAEKRHHLVSEMSHGNSYFTSLGSVVRTCKHQKNRRLVLTSEQIRALLVLISKQHSL